MSGDPFPDLVKRCISSWKEKLPDFNFILWDKDLVEREFQGRTNFTNLDEFREGHEVTNGNLWLKQTIGRGKYAFAADYIRIFALYHYGGIYLDSDVEIIKSFDPFLKHDLFIGIDCLSDFDPAIVGAIPGHPWLKKLLEYYQDRSFIQKDGKLDTRPLPAIFEETARQLFNYKQNGKLQIIEDQGVIIYTCDYFSPKNIYFNRIKKTKNTVSVHHFDGNWVEKNLRYQVKRKFHQALYLMGGKIFHNEVVQFLRKDSLN